MYLQFSVGSNLVCQIGDCRILRVFENRVQRRIFGSKKKEVAVGGEVHSKERHGTYRHMLR